MVQHARSRRPVFLRAAMVFCAPLAPLLIAGCATPIGSLSAPPKWCMAKAAVQEPLKAGDDLVAKHADLKEAAEKERSKNRCLRGYARAVSN